MYRWGIPVQPSGIKYTNPPQKYSLEVYMQKKGENFYILSF
jgi:hypothetical protein